MTACRWTSSTTPRILTGRHEPDCRDEACAGCQACSETHCAICQRVHAPNVCAECVAVARADLHQIATLCGALPEEVAHRGINGEAMMLLGPASDPEARGYLEASVLAGRVSHDALEASHAKGCDDPGCVGCAGELHPLFVLGSWDMVWRDHLEHETDQLATLARLVYYLDMQMTYMAGEALVPFEDFARDLRGCRGHLEAVIHDQNQGDRANVGCFECGGDLERRLVKDGFEDHWTCRKCRRRYTYAEYNFALRANLEAATIREAS